MSVSEVKLIASELGEGGSTREVCPFCGGGQGKERSLSVSVVDGRILWNCHRASCLQSGASGGSRLVRTSQDSPIRERKVTPYTGDLEQLSEEWMGYLQLKIGWHEWHREQGCPMFAPDEDRVAYPIYSPMGLRRGWVLRTYYAGVKPKTLTRMDVDEPHLSFYRPNNTSHVVVVEDIPSAVRAARYVDSVALCGSGASLEYANEISAYYRNAVWALDADATRQSLYLHRKYGILFDSSRVLVLERDLKDEKEDRLCEILSEYSA